MEGPRMTTQPGTEGVKKMQTLVVVGAGGNIGSHFTPLAARLPDVGHLVVVDPDTYEARNLISQNIQREDVGRPKVDVVAERVRSIDPNLNVVAIVDIVQNVPLGRLRGDVIVACLDSRRARQSVNEVAWRLGIPWVDAAVRPEDLLARANVYLPKPDLPCIECSWDDRHYQGLEILHPCEGDGKNVPATNGPADLGALAAALACLECRKILAGDIDPEAAGREILIEARSYHHAVSRSRRNPRCRFDHKTLAVEPLNVSPEEMTVEEALALPGGEGDGANSLRVPGKSWVTTLVCRSCGRPEPLMFLLERLTDGMRTCGECGHVTEPVGFSIRDSIGSEEISPADAGKSLAELGMLPREVFSVETEGGEEFHFELAGREHESETRPVTSLKERVL
jgi:molybdopterin/thiamine biosynthesis adenylyltransferase